MSVFAEYVVYYTTTEDFTNTIDELFWWFAEQVEWYLPVLSYDYFYR